MVERNDENKGWNKALADSRSVAPQFLSLGTDDLNKIRPSALIHLYRRVLDINRDDGEENVREQEARLKFLESDDIDSDELRLEAALYLNESFKRMRLQYDKVTEIAVFETMRSAIVMKMLDYKKTHGTLPSLTVLIADSNRLHQVNELYGHDEGGNVLLHNIAWHLVHTLHALPEQMILNDATYLISRKMGTGDEFIVVFLDDENTAGLYAETLSKSSWPKVEMKRIKGEQGTDLVEASARFAVSNSSLLNSKFGVKNKDPGALLDLMVEMGHRLNGANVTNRSEK